MRLEALRQEHPGKSEEPTWLDFFVWGDVPWDVFQCLGKLLLGMVFNIGFIGRTVLGMKQTQRRVRVGTMTLISKLGRDSFCRVFRNCS